MVRYHIEQAVREIDASPLLSIKGYSHILTKASKIRLSELPILLKMWFLLGELLILQRRTPLPKLLARFDATPGCIANSRIHPERLAYLVTGTVRFTLRDRFCMKRSILLFHFLRRSGEDVRINFGFSREGGELLGHAWIDLDGKPFAEAEDPTGRYVRMYTYPSA